jgi:hypothetical protein
VGPRVRKELQRSGEYLGICGNKTSVLHVKTLGSATDKDALLSAEAYVLQLLWAAQSGRRFVLMRGTESNGKSHYPGDLTTTGGTTWREIRASYLVSGFYGDRNG